ncbi:DUF4234 domain-containing protein [Faecalimonas sp.]
MFCENCGKEMTEDDKFCANCGKIISNDKEEKASIDDLGMCKTSKIKKKKFWKILFLSFVTFGIYGVYILYKFTEDINKICDGDGKKSPNYIIVLLLSFCTCGIYAIYWWYRQADRLKKVSSKYGVSIKETGKTILCWEIFGSLLFGLGMFVTLYIMFENMNRLALVYNCEKTSEEIEKMGPAHPKLVRNVIIIVVSILVINILFITFLFKNFESLLDGSGINKLTQKDVSLSWKKAYLDYLNKIENTEYGYSLDYIDGDDIPELVIDYQNAADGVSLCTYDGTKVIETPVGESLKYRLKENLFCVSGGRMDYYYDIIYKIVDGVPKKVSEGEFGVLDSENVKYDESGEMIYQYFWNGKSVSEYDYYDLTEKFNFENNPDSVRTTGDGYFYDIIEVLEHPLDIVTINPYLNDNGYESLLNNYTVLFDGIEGDKIHFSVTHEDEIVGSASATIVDSKTAKYKNAKCELTIKFNADYKQLEMEGYMDTIDLTGSYIGIWG